MYRLLLVLFMCMGLTGCGVKSSKLEPPEGVSRASFPKSYPDPTELDN